MFPDRGPPPFSPKGRNQKERRWARKEAAKLNSDSWPTSPPPPPAPLPPVPPDIPVSLPPSPPQSDSSLPPPSPIPPPPKPPEDMKDRQKKSEKLDETNPVFKRFKEMVLPILMKNPDFTFPGQTDHPFLTLTAAECKQVLRTATVRQFLPTCEALPFKRKEDAAKTFFDTIFKPEKLDDTLHKKFDDFWRKVPKEPWTLASTWSYSLMCNAGALTHEQGVMAMNGPEAMLHGAMIRYVERTLGLTIEELETGCRTDADATDSELEVAINASGQGGTGTPNPGDPKSAQEIMAITTANLYFPSPYGPIKHFPFFPEIVESFFASDFFHEYISLSSKYAADKQAKLRARYTPERQEASEVTWRCISASHRRAIIATALASVYTCPDPIQIHALPSFIAWCKAWKFIPKVHEPCIFIDPSHLPRATHPGQHPLHWRGEYALESDPMALANDPHHLFSVLGWLTSISALAALPGNPNLTPLGFCTFTNLACPPCRANFALRLQGGLVAELGTRAVPKTITTPRLVRNHAFEPVFGLEGSGEVFSLNSAVFMTELASTIVDIVGDVGRGHVYYSLPTLVSLSAGIQGVEWSATGRGKKKKIAFERKVSDLLQRHREKCSAVIATCQEAADKAECEVLLVEE